MCAATHSDNTLELVCTALGSINTNFAEEALDRCNASDVRTV